MDEDDDTPAAAVSSLSDTAAFTIEFVTLMTGGASGHNINDARQCVFIILMRQHFC